MSDGETTSPSSSPSLSPSSSSQPTLPASPYAQPGPWQPGPGAQQSGPGPQQPLPVPTYAPPAVGPRPIVIARSAIWKFGIAGVVVVLLVVGFAVVRPMWNARATVKAERHIVTEFFADLAKDDTAAALTLVDYPPEVADNPLMAPQALAAPESRPANVRIVSVGKPFAAEDGDPAAGVEIAYTVGGHAITQIITVVHDEYDPGQPYALQNPLMNIAVKGVLAAITINGVAVPNPYELSSSGVLPGAYAASVKGDLLVAATPGSAVYDDSDPTAVGLEITMPAPTPAAGATAAVQKSVDRFIDKCSTSTSESPVRCPFETFFGGSDLVVHWSVVSYPKVLVWMSTFPIATDEAEYSIGSTGVERYTATYSENGKKHRDEGVTRDYALFGSAWSSGSIASITTF